MGRGKSPKTTKGVSDAGQNQAGASVGQDQAGASVGQDQAGASIGQVGDETSVDPMDEEVLRLIRRHANLSFTVCFERGCRFHQSAKEMARYWPEDHPGARKQYMKRIRQPKGSQEGNW